MKTISHYTTVHDENVKNAAIQMRTSIIYNHCGVYSGIDSCNTHIIYPIHLFMSK